MKNFAVDLESLIPRLRRYARALTQHPARADDLVQDTLERAWTRRMQWQAGSDLRAWTFAIMHNVFINSLRRFEAEVVPDRYFEEGLPFAQDVLLDLERAFARLVPEQRTVLLLISLEDLSYQQVSLVLGVPVGTVMSRLARARAALRALMEGMPALEPSSIRPVLKVVK